MSRCAARRIDTSCPPSRMRPSVGSSRPAIIRRVVVLPQPDGPSITKKAPSSIVKLEFLTATKSPNALRRVSMRISAIPVALFREMADDDETQRSHQDHQEGLAIEPQRDRLHQHDDAEADQQDGGHLPRAATEPATEARAAAGLSRRRGKRRLRAHLRTAPKVMPRSRCLRNSTVKQ